MIENGGPQEGTPGLKIETIKGPDGSQVSYCPERGGLITSLIFRGREILYMDEDTLRNPKVSVKGGIPVLFPNAGPIDSPQFPGLKQHGFARDLQWQANKKADTFLLTLTSDDETKKVFPFSLQT